MSATKGTGRPAAAAAAARKSHLDNSENSIDRIIFLDIDGVLLPFPQEQNGLQSNESLFPLTTLHALSTLLEHSKAELVLSSTWRARPSFVTDILDCFARYAEQYANSPLAKVADEGFRSMTDPNVHSERQWEINAWLRDYESKNTSSNKKLVWLALDDEELIAGQTNEEHRHLFEGHVVKTASSKGLSMDDVQYGLVLWDVQIRRASRNKMIK